MTSFQRIIKYGATAFAIFLIVTIIGGAVTGIMGISGLTSIKNRIEENKTDFTSLQQYNVKSDKIEKLDIDVGGADVMFKKGDTFTVEYSGGGFDFEEAGSKLEIDGGADFGVDNSIALVITVPEKMSFDKVSLSAGAGDIYIEAIKCDKLDIDLGAGKLEAEYIKAKNSASIDCGAGTLTINSGDISNADMSLGAGKTVVTAKLSGKSEIDAGVGKFTLTLMGDKSDYTVSADTGIGEFKVDGERIRDSYNIGDGESLVNIDGGIGSVKVEFQQ